ncbi:bacteriophage antitermination protein Q, partial [Escherichia albertii]
AITQWTWSEFKALSGSRKIAGKTLDRLKKLIWLAAQGVKNELADVRPIIPGAGITGGSDIKNRSETFTECRVVMKHVLYCKTGLKAMYFVQI